MSAVPCSDCFTGAIHDGTPTGKVTTLHGIPSYVAEPEEGVTPKGIIVFITDAFGWEFPNNRLLCDRYAKKGGFLVYCPDFMNGHSLTAEIITLSANMADKNVSWTTTLFYKPVWALKMALAVVPFFIRNRPSLAKPRIFNFVRALRESEPPFPTNNLKIGAAGFCWGGKHAILLAANTPSSRIQRHSSQTLSSTIEPLVDCCFTAHPSLISMPSDIEAVSLPLSVAIGNDDEFMKAQKIEQMREILMVKKKGDNEVVILPGAKHGFAVRTHKDDKEQMAFADTAEEQAINWFTRWFT